MPADPNQNRNRCRAFRFNAATLPCAVTPELDRAGFCSAPSRRFGLMTELRPEAARALPPTASRRRWAQTRAGHQPLLHGSEGIGLDAALMIKTVIKPARRDRKQTDPTLVLRFADSVCFQRCVAATGLEPFSLFLTPQYRGGGGQTAREPACAGAMRAHLNIAGAAVAGWCWMLESGRRRLYAAS